MPSNAAITCPTDCGTDQLGPLDSSLCAPQFRKAQVSRLFLTAIDGNQDFGAEGTPTTGVDLAGAWTNRIDQTAQATGAVIILHGIGEVPEPNDDEQEFSLGRKVVIEREHTLSFTVDESTYLINNFLRKVAKCGGTYGVWYETAAPDLYGSEEGVHKPIQMTLKAARVISRNRTESTVWQVTGTWKTKGFETLLIDSPVPDTPEYSS